VRCVKFISVLHDVMNFSLWIDCSVTVMFAIQPPLANIGQSLNQHIAMLRSMLEIGHTKGI